MQVNTVALNYAKTAKKMDMKRLKSSMWTLLTDSPENPSKVQDSERPSVFLSAWKEMSCNVSLQESATEETLQVCGDKVFSQTTKTLLQRYQSSARSWRNLVFVVVVAAINGVRSVSVRLPNTMSENLSVPLAFVALLHLANEKVSDQGKQILQANTVPVKDSCL